MNNVTLKAPAKINLYLKITGRRADGYHTLETFMQKLDLHDVLQIRKVESEGVVLHCPGSDLPETRDNLAFRAAELYLGALEKEGAKGHGVEITLEKNIPVAAGLGGGSSDAAAVLRGLNRLHDDYFSNPVLEAQGLRLGADVPFFVNQAPACFAEGIGEVLKPAPSIANVWFVLVNPGFSVSTKWAYENFALTIGSERINLENSRTEWWGGRRSVVATEAPVPPEMLLNDLEKITTAAYPEIEQIGKELIAQGASATMMSGSGPTVFGVFEERGRAESCRELFKERYTSTFVASPLTGSGHLE